MVAERLLEKFLVGDFVIPNLNEGFGFLLRDPFEGIVCYLRIEGGFQLLERVGIIQYRNIPLTQVGGERRLDTEIRQCNATNHNARGRAAPPQNPTARNSTLGHHLLTPSELMRARPITAAHRKDYSGETHR